MIKFDIHNRLTRAVKFTAEIDCHEGERRATKLRLAVEWARQGNADLSYTDLRGADLAGVNLMSAYLEEADLSGADLYKAFLYRANLTKTNLYNANLACANISRAILPGADLTSASLYDANLAEANISRTNLTGSAIYKARLAGAHGINDWVKCIQIERYPIAYTSDVLDIGCKQGLISAWKEVDDRCIIEMGGRDALRFWRKYKDWIFQTIELCPAKPTKTSECCK